jgi:hypothetical protein
VESVGANDEAVPGDAARNCVITGMAVGRDSSVGMATRYGLDGPGLESRRGRDFPNPSRPALGPTQHPIQLVLGLSRG